MRGCDNAFFTNDHMPIKNLLYLLQLEMYDVARYKAWLQKNPGRIVEEKKKRLLWTKKVKVLYILARLCAPLFGNERAIVCAARILSPIDWCLKRVLLICAWFRMRIFFRHTLVIGICGSWGKTTAKEILYEILRTQYRVYRTKENDNTLLGIALNILVMPRDAEIFIVEMDAWAKGELSAVCRLVRPTIGIMTAIGPTHLERFTSIQDLYSANLELYDALPQNGFALVPKEIERDVKKREGVKTIFFEHSDEIFYAMGKSFDIDAKIIKEKIKTTVVEHRLSTIRSNGITVLDNAYNSNPASFRRSLAKLASFDAPRKIIVTPGMIELGERQFSENKKAGEEAARVCTHIIIVGETNRLALRDGVMSVKKRAKIIEVATLEDAKKELSKIAEKGSSVVLFENDLPDHYF